MVKVKKESVLDDIEAPRCAQNRICCPPTSPHGSHNHIHPKISENGLILVEIWYFECCCHFGVSPRGKKTGMHYCALAMSMKLGMVIV